MPDTTILIENPEIVRDIQKLAAQTGKPEADAVADAVRAQLEESHREFVAEDDELDALLAEIDALPKIGPALTDDELYDKDGLPR